MDEKVGKLDNRAEAEFKIALAKYYQYFGRKICLETVPNPDVGGQQAKLAWKL